MACFSSKSSLNSLLDGYNSRLEKKKVSVSAISESTMDDVVKKISAAEVKDSDEAGSTGDDGDNTSSDTLTSVRGEDQIRELAKSLIDPILSRAHG